MSIKHLLFSFKGRINRSLYWKGYLINFVILLIPIIIFSIFGAAEIIQATSGSAPPDWIKSFDNDNVRAIATLIIIPTFIAGMWSSFAVQAKRFHDLNLSGILTIPLFILTILLGFLAVIAITVLGSIKGTSGPNKYGTDPLGKSS